MTQTPNIVTPAIGVVVGIGLTGAALLGNFDPQTSYCDARTNPCTPAVIPQWYGSPPPTAKLVRQQPGSGIVRTLAGISSAVLFASTYLAFSQAAEKQRQLDSELAEQDAIFSAQSEILVDEAVQKTALAADLRVQQFRRDLYDAAALDYLQKNPDLLQPPQPKALPQPEPQPIQEAELVNDNHQENPNQQPSPDSAKATPTDKPNTTANVLDPSESTAITILNELVGTRRSTLLIGGTGAGKSVTEAYILTHLFKTYPDMANGKSDKTYLDADAWVIAQKNDSFCGLNKKGRVILFDPINPTAALSVIDRVYSIYDQRRRLPEQQRQDLPPVRLILADWLSINNSLQESKDDPIIKQSKYLVKVPDIVYNGRELNVCLIVDLQSYNLTAVGLKADRNSRKNFNLIGLGNYSINEDGSVDESYGVLSNLIGDKNIVDEEAVRTHLLETFRALKPISAQNQRPIIFSSLEPQRVAILPDLRHYKPGLNHRVRLEGYTPEILERILKLEFDIDDFSPSIQEANSSPSSSRAKDILLTWFKGKGWSKFGEARSACKDLRKVTKDAQEVRQILLQLKEEGLAEVNPEQTEFLIIDNPS